MLLRIGLALAAGLLIAVVPIALRKARFAVHLGPRIAGYAIALLALAGFGAYGWYLWNHYVPREPAAPAPITYPQPPSGP